MRSPITSIPLTALLALAGPSAACVVGEAEDEATHERAAAAPTEAPKFAPASLPEQATKPAPAVAAPELPSPPAAVPAPVAEQWQGWLDGELARIQGQAPEWFEHVMQVAPKRTRSGFLRLVGPELEDPNAAPVLLHRYLSGDESPEVEAAVLAALVRTHGDYAGVLVELLPAEPDPLVRVAMVSSLRRVPGPDALAVIEAALGDENPQVRVAAANVAGRHAEGANLAAPLIAALDDLPEVQVAAARSLGYLHVEDATAALRELLVHANADVRLSSLQAIDRIDPAYAAGLGQLDALIEDVDPKVARAARKIAAR